MSALPIIFKIEASLFCSALHFLSENQIYFSRPAQPVLVKPRFNVSLLALCVIKPSKWATAFLAKWGSCWRLNTPVSCTQDHSLRYFNVNKTTFDLSANRVPAIQVSAHSRKSSRLTISASFYFLIPYSQTSLPSGAYCSPACIASIGLVHHCPFHKNKMFTTFDKYNDFVKKRWLSCEICSSSFIFLIQWELQMRVDMSLSAYLSHRFLNPLFDRQQENASVSLCTLQFGASGRGGGPRALFVDVTYPVCHWTKQLSSIICSM